MTDKKDSFPNKRDSSLESLLHSEHTVIIEKMSVGGDGVARIPFGEEGKKIVVFVSRSAPQDQLRIKITQIEKNFLIGKMIEILKPGPSRRIAPCPVAQDCGGCSWQHFNESEQIHQKELLLVELFKKFLPTSEFKLEHTISTEQKFEYRNRIQLKHFQNQLGYFKPHSHEIIPIQDCLIAEAPLRQKIHDLNLHLKFAPELKKYELKINQDQQVEHYEIGMKSEGLAFSQVNNFVNHLLVEKTIELTANLIDLNDTPTITELYAGAGNFTFALAQKFPKIRIEAVELNERLTSAAVELVKKLKLIKQITFFTTKSETFAQNYPFSNQLVLIDPPRSGCHPDVIHRIASAHPDSIIYISCHPTMLVRDLALLFKNQPAYRVQYLQIFDMFPQTDHFETLCVLSKV